MYTASPVGVFKRLQRCSIIFISRNGAGLFVQQKQTVHHQNYKFSVSYLTGNSHRNYAMSLLSYNITNFKRKEMAWKRIQLAVWSKLAIGVPSNSWGGRSTHCILNYGMFLQIKHKLYKYYTCIAYCSYSENFI